jgi:hypothetical protein
MGKYLLWLQERVKHWGKNTTPTSKRTRMNCIWLLVPGVFA